ncbi:MAG TPA: Fe-S cluster assembly protein SufD [Candidatus Hydrogenedentes bacterium]|nr:Fe-S cluster assembly protein SufD [Candidatus Hydrogenedentota bacterium]
MSDSKNTANEKASFLSDLDQLRTVHPAWVKSIQTSYAAKFAELELPNRRMEEWRFTNVSPILRTSFRTAISPGAPATEETVAPFRYGNAAWAELVFVDGFFAASLSRIPSGLIACNLAEALEKHTDRVEPLLAKQVNGTANAFNALNTAFLQDGAFVHVTADAVVPAPIHLLYVNSGRSTDSASHPRNLLILDRGAKATVVESHVSADMGARYFTNAVTEIVIGENAALHAYKLINDSNEAYHLASTHVRLERGASINSFAISQTGKIIRNEIKTLLDGEGAHSSLKGLYMTRGEQLVDNPIAIEHAKPHCTSWIGYKGVLDDKSHAVFSGKVYVHRVAQKTDSNQLNQNMLLSDKATIDTKPLLEIFADDVKCTHGATVGRPPEELVFYFRTRGMSEAMALGMLTYGFADEVVNQIGVDEVRERLEKFVFDTYSPIPG